MQTRIGIPTAGRRDDAAEIWRQLRASAVPFPFECSDAELTIGVEGAGCELQPGAQPAASAEFLHRQNIARICLFEEFFALRRCVQLGVLLHEAIHIRLSKGRLHRNFLVSSDLPQRKAYFEPDEDIVAYRRHQLVAAGLLNLPAEIGVDKFMASTHYQCVPPEYWRMRCQTFYRDAPLAAPEDITPTLRPYVAFHRLVALRLGLLVVTSAEDRQALHDREGAYVRDLETCCDEETASWLRDWGTKLLALDPVPTDPDSDAYDELSERVLRLV